MKRYCKKLKKIKNYKGIKKKYFWYEVLRSKNDFIDEFKNI